MDNTTKTILLLAGVGLAAFGVYTYMNSANQMPPPPGGIPGGQNGWYQPEGGGTPVWVNAVGATVTILNGLGQVIGNIPWDEFFNNNEPASGTYPSPDPGDYNQGPWA